MALPSVLTFLPVELRRWCCWANCGENLALEEAEVFGRAQGLVLLFAQVLAGQEGES